jgi:hypothetical protein
MVTIIQDLVPGDDVVDALAAILDYLTQEEEPDYHAASREQRRRHIYQDGLLVRRWLDDVTGDGRLREEECACCRMISGDLRIQHFENAPGQASLVQLCGDCFAATDCQDPEEAIRCFRRCARDAALRRPTHPGFPLSLGRVVVTRGALYVLSHDDIRDGVDRHSAGDWGDCCATDAAENDFALTEQRRVLSLYRSPGGVKFLVITEADRSATTVLLPEEY